MGTKEYAREPGYMKRDMPEALTGPDESGCPSPIAVQLQRQSQSLGELGKALDSLSHRLGGVLDPGSECKTENPVNQVPAQECSSELALALCHDVKCIDELREIVKDILNRLEV